MSASAHAKPPAEEAIRLRILVPLVVAIVVLLGTFTLVFHQEQRERALRGVQRSASDVQHLLTSVQKEKAAVMRTALIAARKDLVLAEAFRQQNRELLLERSQPLFESLGREHRITHFYFHSPARTNLLRLHRPEQYGDLIKRHTALEAERTGQVVSGIEGGPIGTLVLRVIAPWHHEGQFLGYLELGAEFQDILTEIHGLLDVDFVAAVNKTFLDRRQWDKGLKAYRRTASWDEFPHVVVMDKTLSQIPPSIRHYLASERGAKGSGTNHVARWGGQALQTVFLPLSDITGRDMGELIVVRDVSASEAQARSAVRTVILICVAVSAVLVGLFYLLLVRVEEMLATRSGKLRSEIAERERAEQALRQAQDDLERRVEERTCELKELNAGLTAEIVAREKAQAELDDAHRRLVESSRLAGMAEVATGVLHNVGNVLNSVNVSASYLTDTIKQSRRGNLSKAVALMREHAEDLGAFITTDPRGRQLPSYLEQLSQHLLSEQGTAIEELTQLRTNIDHIKQIVAMQQSYAKVSGVTEVVSLANLVDDALSMNAAALLRHEVTLEKDYRANPTLVIEKHKVLQILINLIRNAKYACDETIRADKRILVRVSTLDQLARIEVIDNGVGIAPENLTRIFQHGFTTRKEGHGFGLHSGALAARELGGALRVESDGVGLGATFVLDLPLHREELQP